MSLRGTWTECTGEVRHGGWSSVQASATLWRLGKVKTDQGKHKMDREKIKVVHEENDLGVNM